MITNNQMLEMLAESPMFQAYERAYSETTGLPLSLRPVESWQLPLHGKRHENPFCALVAAKSQSCAACLRNQEQLVASADREPTTMTCTYGLCETAVPVKLGTQTIGYLQTGQVLRQKPTDAAFQRAAQAAQSLGVDLGTEEARTAYFNTPVLGRKKLESISCLLTILAEHLSIKSNQLALQRANSEPPMVIRAKQYIEEHYSEDISLGQVAQAVHTSVFYFCKMFHKHTGVRFTEFVCRTRVEKAKNLLLNPNLRVSEIAFEVGFQSLTHFNRAFKKVVGEAPTEYRRHLPGTTA